KPNLSYSNQALLDLNPSSLNQNDKTNITSITNDISIEFCHLNNITINSYTNYTYDNSLFTFNNSSSTLKNASISSLIAMNGNCNVYDFKHNDFDLLWINI